MEQQTKKCPYCGEEILAAAKKCKYCGEWLEEKENATPAQSIETAEEPPVNKLMVVKAVKEAARVSLKEAKDAVDAANGDFDKAMAILHKPTTSSEPKHDGTKNCPHCGEEILATAKKCKHCGEWLEQQPAEQNANDLYQEDISWDADDVWGCLWWIIIIVGLIWAYNDKPSEEEFHQAILEEVRDEVADKTSTALDILGGEEYNGIGSLASIFINESSTAMESISKSFYQNNEIRINEHWFYHTAEIVNSNYPTGTVVALGICGIVIPFVAWDDFKLADF